jgi:hypothetical protein
MPTAAADDGWARTWEPSYDARDLHAYLEAQVGDRAAPGRGRRLTPLAGVLLAFGAAGLLWVVVGQTVIAALK